MVHDMLPLILSTVAAHWQRLLQDEAGWLAWGLLAGVMLLTAVVAPAFLYVFRKSAAEKRNLERRVEQQRAIIATTEDLAPLAAPDAVSERAATLLHQAYGFDGVTVYLLEANQLVVSATAGHPQQVRGANWSAPILIGEQQAGRVDVTSKRPLDAAQRALVAHVVRQTGIALSNARQCESLRHAAAFEERSRLARDLHDAVTQSIYSLTLLAEAGQRMIRQGEWEKIADNQVRMADIAQQVLQEIRLKVYQLRPFTLRPLGLVGALDQRLDTVERRAGIEARLRVLGNAVLPDSLEEELFFVAQEALNNALKYARATAVSVAIRFERGCVRLTVQDNGRGFEPLTIGHQGGMGLIGMQERTMQIGGELSIRTEPGKGTAVTVTAPIATEMRPAALHVEELAL